MLLSEKPRIPVFLSGLLRMPRGWQVWVLVLMLINGVAPLVFLGHGIAIEALVAMGIAAAIGMALAEIHGFTRLLGIMHLPWLVLVPRALARIPKADGGLRAWLLTLVALDSISLLIDTSDVLRFLAGERASTVPLDRDDGHCK